MAMIVVNGVTLPVALESLTISEQIVGATMRNAHGWALRTKRAVKRTLAFELTPKSLEEAMLYRTLITGEGEFWSMGSSIYGAKGLAITGTGSHDTTTANTNLYSSNAKGAWALDAGETMVVACPMPSQVDVAGVAKNPGWHGSTLIGWRMTSGSHAPFGWSWTPAESSPGVKRTRSGNAWPGAETFVASTMQLQVTAPGAGGPWYYSNMMWLPRRFKQAEVDLLLDGVDRFHGLAAPPLPRVMVTTDLFPEDLNGVEGEGRTFIALGEVKTSAAVPVYRGGVWDPSSLSMTVELVEV